MLFPESPVLVLSLVEAFVAEATEAANSEFSEFRGPADGFSTLGKRASCFAYTPWVVDVRIEAETGFTQPADSFLKKIGLSRQIQAASFHFLRNMMYFPHTKLTLNQPRADTKSTLHRP